MYGPAVIKPENGIDIYLWNTCMYVYVTYSYPVKLIQRRSLYNIIAINIISRYCNIYKHSLIH